jgi:hypothetical protein
MNTIINLTLTRDQARKVQEDFFPYLEELTELKIREAGKDESRIFNCRAISTLLFEVTEIFEHILSNRPGNDMEIPITYSEALALHDLLKELPIAASNYWHVNLRDSIIAQCHSKLSEP